MSAYKKLKNRFKQIYTLTEIQSLINWDASVLMPKGASHSRGEHIGLLSSIKHKMLVAGKTQELLDESEVELSNSSNVWDLANLRQIKHTLAHANAVPSKLVAKLASESHKCEVKWRKARKNNDFKYILPHLRNLLELVREEANYKAEALKTSPYQALLDSFDQGRTTAEIDSEFDKLKKFLPSFIKEVTEKQNPKGQISWEYPIKNQKALAKHYMKAFGFDMNRGRLDKSTHPFCGGGGDDIRITTRYNKRDFLIALMGVIHETGHALYEQNLPKEYRGQPVGESNGMAIHEGQSLFLEKQIGKSPAFIEHLHDQLHQFFPNMTNISLEKLQDYMLHVEPSFIRVDADEVTYPAHVIVRYELEKAMIEGKLEIKDLPEAFNDGIEKILGIRPTKDSDGCLQDVHWFAGLFGYFPTYTLGAMTAAQIMNTIRKEMKVDKLLRDGDFTTVLRWNTNNIHFNASLYSPSDLTKVATGEKLNSDYFIEHLKSRYS